MTETINVDGESYELNGNPTLRTVRNVQSMDVGLLLEYLSEDDLKNADSLESETEIVQMIVEENGIEAFHDVQWEKSLINPIQTISLAADECFETEDFDDMTARDFKWIRQSSEEALGGNADDFFEELGIGMSLTEEEMNRENV